MPFWVYLNVVLCVLSCFVCISYFELLVFCFWVGWFVPCCVYFCWDVCIEPFPVYFLDVLCILSRFVCFSLLGCVFFVCS